MLDLIRCKYLGIAFLVLAVAGCGNQTADNQTPVVEDNHKADEAKLAALFPDAKLTEKSVPLNNQVLERLSAKSGKKFTGAEKEWEIFEATKNGKRVGLAMLAHADLSKSVEIHIGFSVNPQLQVVQTIGIERTNEGFKQLVRQFQGKSDNAPFQLGKNLKEVADYPPQFSQAVADTVHKGLVVLREYSYSLHTDKK